MPSLVLGERIYGSCRQEKSPWLEILLFPEVSQSRWDEASGELGSEEGGAGGKHRRLALGARRAYGRALAGVAGPLFWGRMGLLCL